MGSVIAKVSKQGEKKIVIIPIKSHEMFKKGDFVLIRVINPEELEDGRKS